MLLFKALARYFPMKNAFHVKKIHTKKKTDYSEGQKILRYQKEPATKEKETNAVAEFQQIKLNKHIL